MTLTTCSTLSSCAGVKAKTLKMLYMYTRAHMFTHGTA